MKGTKGLFTPLLIVFCVVGAAVAQCGWVTNASAQTLTEGWGGIPPGGTLDQLQYYNTGAEACKSIEGAYIPYFGYSVNTLINVSPAPDVFSQTSLTIPTSSFGCGTRSRYCVFN